MKRVILLFACIAASLMMLQAEKVDAVKAGKVARAHVELQRRLPVTGAVQLKYTAGQQQNRNTQQNAGTNTPDTAFYYVFNVDESAGGGFVIVAGDDAVRPVLGYSSGGSYDENSLPPNFAGWMDFMQQEIRHAITQKLPQSETVRQEWERYLNSTAAPAAADAKSVAPLIATQWNQSAPYWNLCPQTAGGQNTYTGCVATAMAQIMKYHNYPARGTGQSEAYTTRTLGINVPAVSFDVNYQWANMLNTYTGSASTAQMNAVATLMYHCGASVQMDYSSDGSGAYSQDVPAALTTHFGYDKSIQHKYRSVYTDTEWENMLREQLDANLPVYYSGDDGSSGHAFVCDGYNNSGYFHFNWGWSGMYDGYFITTTLNPGTGGAGAGDGVYSQNQAIVVNIKPNVGGAESYEIVLTNVFTASQTSAQYNEEFTVSANIYNMGWNTWPGGDLSVALVDQNNQIVAVTGDNVPRGELSGGYLFNNPVTITCNIPSSVAHGAYRLRAVVRTGGGSWNVIGGSYGCPSSIDFYVGDNPNPGDQYEPNDSPNDAYALPVTFNGNSAVVKTADATIHTETDIDYYNLTLPAGETYMVTARLQDSYSSNDGNTYTLDAKMGYWTGDEWETFDDVMPNITSGGGTLYFSVAPYFVGNMGTYLLDINIQSIGDIPCDNPIATGTTGNLIWTLCPDGTLSIIGNGPMPDYYPGETPWYNHESAITAVEVVNGVTSIGAYAFSYHDNLVSATIPASVTSIGEAALWQCPKLIAIEVAASNPSYLSENGVLFNKNKTTLIQYPGGKTGAYAIPAAVTLIENNAFDYCTGLTSVTIPNSVTTIESRAFRGCTGLTSVTIPSSVTEIGDNSFGGCTGLIAIEVAASNLDYSSENGVLFDKNKTYLYQYPAGKAGAYTIPASTNSIWYNAFESCSKLTSVVLHNSVTQIVDYAFMGCTGLTSITFPESLRYFGTHAFANCTGLTSVTVPSTYLNTGIFSGCTGLTSVTIPSSVTRIGDDLFYGCTGLTSITIPNLVTEIGDYAFMNCSNLASVTIGTSVDYIGYAAFAYCESLTEVTNFANTPQTIDYDDYVFEGCNISACKLRVLESSIEAYRAANIWKNFGTIEAIADDTPLAEGTTGNLEWALYYNGTLTITGNGAMPDYDNDADDAPWYDWRNLISNAVIGNGVTSIGNYAFARCSNLPSVTIPNSVTSIGNYAFNGCTGLTSVTIPNSVTTIGEGAFSYSGLTSIFIPNSVTSIGDMPFGSCFGLTAIDVASANPNYLSENGVLFNRNKTTLIQYPAGIVGVAYTIPNSVTTIGGGAFRSCTGLTTVAIPNSVITIGDYAFYDCSGLTSITIPNSVTTIGNYAFCYCSGLTSITIPNSVITIGEYAFQSCNSLTSITIGSSVATIGYLAFWSNMELTSIEVVPDNPNFSSENGVLFNKDKTTLLQYPFGKTETTYTIPSSVTTIDHHAFSHCYDLTSITIPNSVITIGEYAFLYCEGLVSVTIGNSVTTIVHGAFAECWELTSVVIGSSVTAIGEGAFSSSTNLTSVTNLATTPQTIDAGVFNNIELSACTLRVPESSIAAYRAAGVWKNFGAIKAAVDRPCDNPIATGITGTLEWMLCPDGTLTIIGDGAMPDYKWNGSPWYDWRESISSVVIGDGVTSIGQCAFAEYSGITSVTISNTVTTIGEAAFDYCQGLTSVTIGNSVTSIGEYAFEFCSKLTSVTIPNSVTSIGRSAFSNCGFTSVAIPQSVITIGNNAFSYCTGLTAIEVAASNPNYSSENGALFNKDKTTLIVCPGGKTGTYVIPSSVTTIGDSAFSGCTGLTAVNIPNSVITIENYAFSGCTGLTTVAIPQSVTTIGGAVFSYCTGLTSIEVAASNPNFSSENGALFNKNKTTLILCPIGKTGTYVIPSSVTTIGNSAFSGCRSLTTVAIPQSVTTIGNSAFSSCSGLTSITIPNSVTTIESWAFDSCSGLTSITIPNSVTTIESWAFSSCSGLTSVTIPNSVITIGSSVFFGCTGLTSVTIGSSVTLIGYYAFEGCESLTSVTNLATTPQVINDYHFYGVDISACILRVPENSVATYRAAEVWKEFMIEGITVGIHNNTLTGITVRSNGSSISITNNSGIALREVQIIDLQGRIVYSGKTSSSVTIPVNGTGGIYIVKLVSDDNKTLSTKVHVTM